MLLDCRSACSNVSKNYDISRAVTGDLSLTFLVKRRHNCSEDSADMCLTRQPSTSHVRRRSLRNERASDASSSRCRRRPDNVRARVRKGAQSIAPEEVSLQFCRQLPRRCWLTLCHRASGAVIITTELSVAQGRGL
jgi:hypothetical protein